VSQSEWNLIGFLFGVFISPFFAGFLLDMSVRYASRKNNKQFQKAMSRKFKNEYGLTVKNVRFERHFWRDK